MLDEMITSYMEPMGQHSLQGLSRRGSWNPVSSPSSPLSRVAPPTPTGSRLGAYTMPLYVSASPRTFRKNNEIFDISDTDKHEIRLAFELFDTRKVGRLGYRDLKVITMTILINVLLRVLVHVEGIFLYFMCLYERSWDAGGNESIGM